MKIVISEHQFNLINESDVNRNITALEKHWRKKFEGNICAQVFLHYNGINGPFKIENT